MNGLPEGLGLPGVLLDGSPVLGNGLLLRRQGSYQVIPTQKYIVRALILYKYIDFVIKSTVQIKITKIITTATINYKN